MRRAAVPDADIVPDGFWKASSK